MKIRVDEDKCCGYSTCISAAPEVFDIDNDQIAFVITDGDNVPERLWDSAREAAEGCPTDAIIIEE